jgi:hypothetical protein
VRILALLVLMLASAQAAPADKSFEAQCGPARFQVHVEKNRHELVVVTASGTKPLFIGGEDSFHAACMTGAKGGPVLVFQSYCGGSGCAADKYGIVDAGSLEFLLRPSPRNLGNASAASKLLDREVPNLADYKPAFCCRK